MLRVLLRELAASAAGALWGLSVLLVACQFWVLQLASRSSGPAGTATAMMAATPAVGLVQGELLVALAVLLQLGVWALVVLEVAGCGLQVGLSLVVLAAVRLSGVCLCCEVLLLTAWCETLVGGDVC